LEGKGIKMLVSIIIIKLIINLIRDITIPVQLRLCFKTKNLFGAQFGELGKIYINSHKKYLHEDLGLIACAFLIICCVFAYRFVFYLLFKIHINFDVLAKFIIFTA